MLEAEVVLKHAKQLVVVPPGAKAGGDEDLGVIEDGALAIAKGRVLWVGPTAALGQHVRLTARTKTYHVRGRVVTPGLVDPHTHLVFAGTREEEFAQRAAGRPYLEILAAGGGILSTVRATRAASDETLLQLALARLDRCLSFGVTTIEAKSGYGLSLEHELRILRTIHRAAELHPIRLVPTVLAAHAVPPEFAGRQAAYVRHVIDEILPAVAAEQLAEYCDVFLDEGVFTLGEARRILRRATALGLRPRLHAGQFRDLGGPQLAAQLKAASADHLEHISEAGLRAMAKSGVTAILLPGAALSLGRKPPDARPFLQAGVPVALATDLNPGTSMTENLLLMMTLGVTQQGLTPAQALRAVTDHAAAALDRSGKIGTLVVGAEADAAVFDVSDWRQLAWHFGVPHAELVLVAGKVVWSRGRTAPSRQVARGPR